MKPEYVQTVEELAAVVEIGTTPESVVLEFKATIDNWNLPKTATDRDRLKAEAQQETCRDVAQFANTIGGCLLIGVEERLDPDRGLRVADSISPVTDPERMKQWIEQAIRNYLVPAIFSHDIVPVDDPRGTVLAINVPPSIHLITLWDSQRHTIECMRRTSHGKDWMNPDELERHIMNGSRASKLAFDLALTEVPTREIRVAGGYWQRVGNPPVRELQRWSPETPVIVGRVTDQWFQLDFTVGPVTRSLILPFGVVEQAWHAGDERVHVILSVRVVHVVISNELTLEPYT